MEDYPEELRTPPLSLVSIVGCPELHPSISAALSSQQPPMNTLALPDFTKASILARSGKARDPLAPPQAPAGILKKDWLLKHRTRVPAAVAALFRADQVSGDPAQWLQACSDLENLKSAIQGINTKLVVVLVQAQASDELSEDVTVALRKRAEIDSKHLVVLVEHDEAEWNRSLSKLKNVFAELCSAFYKEEGRRIKARIEKRNFSSVELSIRYCFKVAVYAEFRRDWPEALKFYEEGVRVLREMIGTSTRLPPTQRLVEIKAVAEQFHFKISTLLLHAGKVVEAIMWFRKHIRSYERVVGTPEVAFLHWEWFSRQFLVFGELIETTSATVPDTLSPRFGTADNALTEWEFQPAYYYQLAATYLREKRYAIECSSSTANLTTEANGIPESVMPSVYVGQYVRLFEQGDTVSVLPLSDTEYTSYALSEAERFQDSYEIIALFRKAYESFQSLGATRMASSCSRGMAIEYYAAGDFSNAKQLFDGVAGLYRQEGWTTLLWENLGYLRECSRKLNFPKDFISYSLEMAALPLFSGSVEETRENKIKSGPAGSPTISRRENILQEVVNVLERKQPPEGNDDGFSNAMEETTHLDIDQISPLRMVLTASVAFHDQSVKPGSPLLISVSLLSHLPSPVVVDQLEVQFNQSDCNFVIHSTQEDSPPLDSNLHGQVVEATSLTLFTNKWMRLTREIKSGQSGKLECLLVKATINKHLVICCHAESPASMEDFPLWKFEDQVETLPTKDNVLAFSGQKLIQVEEPDAQVDVVLNSAGPALVGEIFIVPVTVFSKGHTVHSGELKINLVDARGGGLLMSPREAEESESHHVELLGVSTVSDGKESKEEVDSIRKIQYSFGVVSVPTLSVGDSWSCKLEIKWHRAKSVMLYVSLGYSLGSSEEEALHRLNVHRSLQIEGQIPLLVTHQLLRPFRREPLLLSEIRSLGDGDKKCSLAMNESNMFIVNARNCTEVPLRLHSMTIEPDDDGKQLCSVQQVSGISNGHAVIAPSEEYKGIFSVNPRASNSNFHLGEICLNWSRDSRLGEAQERRVIMKQRLPEVSVEEPPLVVSMECPPYVILGIPFTFYVKIHNSTPLLQAQPRPRLSISPISRLLPFLPPMAAAIGSPSRAAAAAAAPSRSSTARSPLAVLRVASSASSAASRRGAVAAAAMRPAKAVAAEAPSAAVENGAAVAGMARPDTMGRFGKFGGKYVPETLMHALTELENAFHALATDEEFQKELDGILKDYVGRESPLYFAERLTEHYKRTDGTGPLIYLKREDLNHTGAHKINNAVAQALLAKRLGKQRIIAETGAGQHGVATATVCARFGLQCIIYMGAQDMERQALNVFRMRLLGAEVRAVHSGTATLKDATSEAIRDWVTNVETTHYILGSVAGPHPYPMMVREFHKVIGQETRRQAMDKWGGKPDVLVACVGGGSNAMGLFHEFVDDQDVRLIGVEAAGHGVDTDKHAATLTKGEVGVLHGSMSYLLQDDDGQVIEPHSISAGLDYPGVGPEHSFLKDIGRAEYDSVTDQEALDAFKRVSRLEGIIPALETSHALAYLEKLCPTLPDGVRVVVNCSGRGDKDVHTASKYLEV